MKKTYILTIEQVKDDLANFYTDKFQQNRELLKIMVVSGKSEFPQLAYMSEAQLIDLFKQLNLGQRYGCEVDIVAVDTGNDYLKIVWKKNA